MSLSVWTLKHLDGITNPSQTFEAWSLQDPQFLYSSHGIDRLTFRQTGIDFDDDASFAAEDTVEIYKDGAAFFMGRVVAVSRSADPASESISYEIAGPGWYLANQVFQQYWQSYSGTPANPLTTVYSSHLVLGMAVGGARQDTKVAIAEAIQFSIDEGAPLQMDQTDWPDIEFPFQEVKDLTVLEAIKTILRWVPDAVAWFDYSTIDSGVIKPTFKIKRRADLTAVSLQVNTTTNQDNEVEAIEINPRDDLHRANVVIKYVAINDVNGTPYHQITNDAVPGGSTGREFKAFTATVDLQGSVYKEVRQEIVVAQISQSDGAWWKDREAWLNDANVSTIQVLSSSRSGSLANELKDGSITDWMNVSVENDTITAKIRVTNVDGSIVEKDVTASVKATNAVSTTYTDASTIPGEIAPVGLGQALFDAFNSLQWEGSVILHQDEVSRTVKLGDKINILGGRTAWETMNAVVWKIDEAVTSGVTRIHFGPVLSLGPGDLVELLRANRGPRWDINVTVTRQNGGGTSGSVNLGKDTPKDNTSGGNDRHKKIVMLPGTGDAGGKVDMDINDVSSGKIMKFRTVNVCTTDSNGDPQTQSMIVLASEVF